MTEEEFTENDKKNLVSIRLNNSDRYAIRTIASRLFVRESELYRFAVNNLINSLNKLHDEDYNGSDLLPLFIGLREELILNLGLKKQQMFKIINKGNVPPEKFVAMADIDLLLLPQHQVRQHLLQIEDAHLIKQQDTRAWLENYFIEKYGLAKTTEKDENEVM
jgi:hypothetical protein